MKTLTRNLFCMVMAVLATDAWGPNLLAAAQAQAVEFIKIMADDGQAYDFFGDSVRLNHDATLLVVGAEEEDERGDAAGAVYILERVSGATGWIQQKKLFASDTAAGDRFGRKLDLDDDLLAVGTFDSAGTGAAYIFERHRGGSNNWGQVTKKTGALDDRFGIRVALSGSTLAVSAPFDDEGATDTGACYIYDRNLGGPDNWGLVKKIKAPDGQPDDRLGGEKALDLVDDTLVVGAQRNDDRGTDAGAVYIFNRNTGGADQWGFVKKLAPDELQSGDQFGHGVHLEGDRLLVSAIRDDLVASNAGAAYLFERHQGGSNNWGLVGKLWPRDGFANLEFGRSVTMKNNLVAVGAFGTPFAGSTWFIGAVYLYQKDYGGVDNWGQVSKLEPTGISTGDLPAFGAGLDLRGGMLAVGSIFDNERGTRAGAVGLFRIFEQPSLSIEPSGSQLQLSWPQIPDLSVILEQTLSLSPAQWEPAFEGNSTSISIAPTNASKFFRLSIMKP